LRKIIPLKNIQGFSKIVSNVISFLCYAQIYLGEIDLRNAELNYCYTEGINLALSDLTNASLYKCNLSYSNLNGAILEATNLKEVEFE